MELLRNRVSEWSYCATRSVGGAIAQQGKRVELLRNQVSGWSYCAIGSVGWTYCAIGSAGGAIAQSGQLGGPTCIAQSGQQVELHIALSLECTTSVPQGYLKSIYMYLHSSRKVRIPQPN